MNQSIWAYLRQSALLLLLGASPFLFSCSTETPDPGTGTTPPGSGTVTTPGTGTVTTPGTSTTATPGVTVVSSVSYIAQNDKLNLLEAAIARAGLAGDFSKENITIFAPSDDAFKAAGYANEAAVSAAPAADLQRILRYHIVNSRIDQSAIPTGVNTSYQTALADNQISVYKASSSDISVNQAKIIQGDNPTTGSVVHIINQVLTPASVNIVALAKSNTNLSLLSAAIDRAGSSVQDVLNKSTQNGYTVFAPTNDAFKAAGYADEAAIKAADQKKLADLLLYHVLNYRAYAQTFQNGADIVTAQGTSVRVNVSNGKVTLLGKGNGSTAANITVADQVASNGIVHVIDRVLLAQ